MTPRSATDADVDGARRAAIDLIDQYGISDPGEIDLEAIAWDLGIDIRESSLKSSEAQLIRKRGAGVIRIRHGEKETPRGRFSIGHELGHWSLHPDQNQYWICTADQIHRYKGNWMEIEANAFSAELLMPTPLFRPYCQKGTAGILLVDGLARLFGTSLQATALRLVDETSEAAMAILTDGEQVLWSKRNAVKLGEYQFHVEKGRPLDHKTKAWNATLDGDSSGEVPARAWFPGLKNGHRYRVYEDVRYIESLEMTLSLVVVQEE